MRPPRYLPSWELPKLPYSPGDGQKPTPIPDPAGGTEDAVRRQFLRGVDLFNHSFYWRAHEAWEELWLSSESEMDRSALKGLIQSCAIMLHLGKGHKVDGLRQRALSHLRAAQGQSLPFDVESFASGIEAYLLAPHSTPRPFLLL